MGDGVVEGKTKPRPAKLKHPSRKVMVVDDEVSVRDALSRQLTTQIGCHVLAVESGDEAIGILEKESYDVVITDMLMPGLHGVELVETLCARWPRLDIIALTGHSAMFPYVDLIEAGANDFILKPFSQEEIEAKVRRILRERILRETLLATERKYHSLFAYSMSPMLLVEPETLAISDANEAFCQMSMRRHADLVSMQFTSILDEASKERFEGGVAIFSEAGRGSLGDLNLLDGKGGSLSLDASIVFVAMPQERLIFLSFRDMTGRRQMEQELADVAHRDSLTGLSNKRAFHMHIGRAMAKALQNDTTLTLMFLDLDNFKQCNDTHGHQTGDEILARVGRLIRASIRKGDEGFRFGGDEFAVLLDGASCETATRIAHRIQEQFAEDECYGTSMSIGVTECAEGLDAESFIGNADKALYKAKALGKNAVSAV